MANSELHQQVRVRQRATGIPGPEVFEIITAPRPTCPPNGILLRVLYTGVDPAMRGWLSAEKNYATVADGEIMRALGVGEIIASHHAAWPVGSLAYGWLGWQQYAAVAPEALLWQVDPTIAPPLPWLSIFGLNGLTAWIGLVHLARAQPHETLLVTTAAGGVGGVVGQLAAAIGMHAVGITGGATKVARATQQLGYHTAINYHNAQATLAQQVATACPRGIDVFFDNTAGWLADAIFPTLNIKARIIQCGTAAIASWLPPPTGPRRERDMVVKRLSWQGFVAFDHTDIFPQALTELQSLYAAGKLTSHDEVLDGLAEAPGAIAKLYRGENLGRLTIRP